MLQKRRENARGFAIWIMEAKTNRLQSWLLTCFPHDSMLGTKPTSSTSEVTWMYPTTGASHSPPWSPWINVVRHVRIVEAERFCWCTSRKTCLTNSSVWAWDAPATPTSQHLGAIYIRRFARFGRNHLLFHSFPRPQACQDLKCFLPATADIHLRCWKPVETFRRNRKELSNCQQQTCGTKTVPGRKLLNTNKPW